MSMTNKKLKNYLLIRMSDNKVVKKFKTEDEAGKYFLNKRSVHKGEGYLLKRPLVTTTGYNQSL